MPAADAEQSIFLATLELKTSAERAAYLKGACGDDAALLANVQGLLAAHAQGDSFLDNPLLAGPATIDERPIAERPGTVIGPYKLMEQIGEGGMGVVFVAEQQHPVRRKVALKVIKPGMDTREVIARFEAERQALALLDHPNIAKILDAGATDSGRPYFVMELVKGIPLTDYCDQHQLTPRERLGLFVSVCQAVQHAHTKGIIHRDLKPANVLIAPHDGKPVVKVIDFGVAKAVGQQLTDKTIYTRLAQMIGTPLYMSPEQAEINALDVDTRSDVYALAVLLYELLTGTTPFDRQRFGAAAFDEIRRIIREEEPPRPSTRLTTLGDATAPASAKRKTELGKLSALVKGDLDWIVMKGLEKDRTRRYETASAFAADVRRYLSEEPVEARPPSAGYRLRKFVKRNRGPVVAAAVVLLAVLAGIVGTSWGWVEALSQRDDAVQARTEEAEQRRLALANAAEAKANAAQATKQEQLAKEQAKSAKDNETKAEWRLYASHIDLAQRELESHNVPLLYHYLNQCRPDFRGWEHDFLYTLANQNQQTLRGHKDGVYGVAFSPDGKLVASAAMGHWDKPGEGAAPERNVVSGGRLPGEVKVWDAASGQALRTLTVHTSYWVKSVAFSPDGKRLASASYGRGGPQVGEIKIWDVASGQPIWTQKGQEVDVLGGKEDFNNVAFSPDGKRVATTSRQHVLKMWDAATGKEILTLKNEHKKSEGGSSVAFSPDSKRLAIASWSEPVKVLDAATGKEILTLQGRIGVVRNIAFSLDGKRLAGAGRRWEVTGTGGGEIKVWDADTGQEIFSRTGHTSILYSVAFSPDGKKIVSSWGQGLKVWDAASGEEFLTLRGHADSVYSVAFSPDGKRLASAAGDGTVKLWDLAGTQGILTLKGSAVAFSPDGKRVATSAVGPGDLKLWDLASGKLFRTLIASPGGTGLRDIHVASSPGGKYLATAAKGTVKLWDADSGKEVRTLMERTPEAYILCLGISPDGKRVAGVIVQGVGNSLARYTAKVWDTANGQEICSFQVRARKVTLPDGMDLMANIHLITGSGDSVTFSPDGKRLTVIDGFLSSGGRQGPLGNFGMGEGPDFTQKVWDADTGQEVLTLKQQSPVNAVAFSPDGKRLATTNPRYWTEKVTPGEVKLWDTASGQNLLTLNPDFDEFGTVALVFSPDGKRLATASTSQNTVKVWDAASGQEVLTLKGHTGGVNSVAFSPDGKRLASASGDQTVRLWDAASGQEVLTLRGHKEGVYSVAFSPDGKRLASAGDTTMIWDASKSMKEIGQK